MASIFQIFLLKYFPKDKSGQDRTGQDRTGQERRTGLAIANRASRYLCCQQSRCVEHFMRWLLSQSFVSQSFAFFHVVAGILYPSQCGFVYSIVFIDVIVWSWKGEWQRIFSSPSGRERLAGNPHSKECRMTMMVMQMMWI